MSWDEDEDGGVVANVGASSSQSDRESLNASTLPDLVSFNLKDGGINSAYLQQLLGSNGSTAGSMGVGNGDNKSGNDTSGLILPLPTPINFGASQAPVTQQQQQQQSIPQQPQTAGTQAQQPAPPAQESSENASQLEGQNAQQAAAPIAPHGQHQQTQQQSQQQQTQQQQQQQHQSQMTQQQLISSAASSQQQSNMGATGTTGQQQVQVTQQTSLPQAGAFSLFQGTIIGQNPKQQPLAIRPAIPTMMIQNVAPRSQEQRTEQQQAPQITFTADPNAFLRQLQVAQLQQHFNAVQQGRTITPQVIATPQGAQVAPGLQHQIAFQAPQVPLVAAPVPSAPPPVSAAPSKRSRSSQKKAAKQTGPDQTTQTKSAPPSLAARAPVVSASDTDGELSAKASSVGKNARKTATGSSSRKPPKPEPADLSNLTPEEKAKANRDRNREHARNTRLRKKAYLEKLKTTVDELCRERDTLVSERAGAANILVEMHNTRTEVLMSFFALRSANEKRRELWASILDESCFACVVPVTPYRSFPASEVQVSKCQRTILGIDGMMADTASLHVLLNSLVDRSRFPNATITFRYTLVTEEAVVAGNQMMARWVMSTLNATQCGARMEVAKHGMLCCKFNSAHKIIGLELMFDVMALMLQLKQAAGSETFSVIPNTVQTCQRTFDKPMVMTLAEEPYTIVQVNKLWEDMTGYKAEEMVGKASCRILEGEGTDPAAVEALMNEIRFKRPASAMIVNYKKTGERFRNFFLAFPLSTDSRITHYLSLSTHVDPIPSETPSQPMTAQQGQASVAHVQNQEAACQPLILGGMQQNLQSAVDTSKQAGMAHHNSQLLYALPPVLSNTGTMLPPSMGTPSGNGVMQHYSLDVLKRGPGEAAGAPPKKQARTVGADDKKKAPSSQTHPK